MKKIKKQSVATIHQVGHYPVIVHEDETKGYWVNCPVFEGCYSQGETIEEALQNIREAIQLCRVEIKKVARQPAAPHIGLHFVTV